MNGPSRQFVMQGVFCLLALTIIFFKLLPLETIPRSWAPPDLLTAFAFAWTLRRPDFLPPVLLAVLLLLADLLLQRPPGLFAALVLLGCHVLRSRAGALSEIGFVGEWTTVAIVLAAIAAIYRVTLWVLVVDQAPLILSIIELVLTIAVYPLTMLISQSILGVRRPGPGDADAMGARA